MPLVVNVSSTVLSILRDMLTSRGGHKVVAEWYRITAKLKPTKGVQFVQPDPKTAALLLSSGLIEQDSKQRYYVPHAVAFVSMEPERPELPGDFCPELVISKSS